MQLPALFDGMDGGHYSHYAYALLFYFNCRYLRRVEDNHVLYRMCTL